MTIAPRWPNPDSSQAADRAANARTSHRVAWAASAAKRTLHEQARAVGARGMIGFFAAVFLLTVTPGPGVLSLAGVGAGFGWWKGFRFGVGIFIGTNLVAGAAASGLAAAILAEPRLRALLAILSLFYLLTLALRIVLAGRRLAIAAPDRAPGVTGGILLQVINPKAYALNITFFANFPLAPSLAGEIALKFLVTNLVFIPVHLAWLWLGVRLGRLNVSPRIQRAINGAMAAAMLLAVALATLMGDL